MRAALHFVTRQINLLKCFNPSAYSAMEQHARVSREFHTYQEVAMQGFIEVLASARRAAGEVGPAPKVMETALDQAFLFISCSSSDEPFARGLTERLRREGFDSFLYVKSIDWGQEIPKRIHEGLDHASHIVVLVSPGSEQSGWVAYEVGYARGRGIEIVPYLLHPKMNPPGFVRELLCLKDKTDEAAWIQSLASFKRPSSLPSSQSFFSEWNAADVRKRLKTATEVWHQAIASSTFFDEVSDSLSQVIENGGSLHCILANPDGEAIRMAATRHVGAARDVDFIKIQVQLAIQHLRAMCRQVPREDSVRLKLVDFLLEPVLTIIDPQLPEAAMFVTLSGFEQRLPTRPCFFLRRSDDERTFDFYVKSFERLWLHPMAQ